MRLTGTPPTAARLSGIAEEVAATDQRVRITKSGRDYVVLLAAEDLESIEATLELVHHCAHRSSQRSLLTNRRASRPEWIRADEEQ